MFSLCKLTSTILKIHKQCLNFNKIVTTILVFRVNPDYFLILFKLHDVAFCFFFMHTQNEKINFTAKQPFCIVHSHNDLDVSFLLTSLSLRCIFFLINICFPCFFIFDVKFHVTCLRKKRTAPKRKEAG